MDFRQTIAAIDTEDFSSRLAAELQCYISCLDIRALTRCGGHASSPQLEEIRETVINDEQLKLLVRMTFEDGDALDCSGHCSGEVTRRRESIWITIERTNLQPSWITTDGVISSETSF